MKRLPFDTRPTGLPDVEPDTYTSTYRDPQAQFTRGFSSGVAQMQASEYAARRHTAELMGDTAMYERMKQAQELLSEYAARVAPSTTSLKDVRSVDSAVDYALGTVGQGVASMGPSIVAGAAGAALGTIGRLGPKVGGAAGSFLASAQMNTGDALKTQYEDPVLAQKSLEDRTKTAYAQGLTNAALDTVGLASVMQGKWLKGMLVEGGTELAQEGVSYLGEKSLDPERDADRWRFIDAFAGGALTGGAVSGTTAMAGRLTSAAIAARAARNRSEFIDKAFQPETTDHAPRQEFELSEQAARVDPLSPEYDVAQEKHDAAFEAATTERTRRMLEDPTLPFDTQEKLRSGEMLGDEVAALEAKWAAERQAKDVELSAKALADQAVDQAVDAARLEYVTNKLADRFPGADMKHTAEVLAKFDTKETSDVYDARALDISNLKRVAEITGIEPTVNDSLYAQVYRATNAANDAVLAEPTMLSKMIPDFYDIKPEQRVEIAKMVDELSLYPPDEQSVEQVAAMGVLDEVFGDRDRTLQVLDHYAQKNLPSAAIDPRPSLAPERYTNVDAPTLTFNDPRKLAAVAKDNVVNGAVSEAVSLREYADKFGLDKEALLSDALTQVKDAAQVEKLAEILGAEGVDAALDQFTLNRVREEVRFASPEQMGEALGVAMDEYASAPMDRRQEIADSLAAYRPMLEARLESANPIERGQAERMLAMLDEADNEMAGIESELANLGEPDIMDDSTVGDEAPIPDTVEKPEYVRYSKQNSAGETSAPIKMTQAERQAIIDSVVKLLGKDIEVLFTDLAGAAGSFTKTELKETIRISLSALNPQSIAHHEAMHALFARLSSLNTPEARSIMETLTETASQPEILGKMRELLKDHPDALRQLEHKEERLAYLYQFWAAGDIALGKLNDTPVGFLQKIKDFLTKTLYTIIGINGSNADIGKTQQIFDAFTAGKFAVEMTKPSVFALAMHEVLSKDQSKFQALADQIMAPISEGYRKLTTTTTDQLRRFGNDKLSEIADLFQPAAGEAGKQGFLSARTMEYSAFTNEYADLTEGYSAAELDAAARHLASMKDPSTELEHQLKGFFDKIFDYVKEADVKNFDPERGVWKPINKINHYYPRYWSESAIVANKDRLIDLMVEHNPNTRDRTTAAEFVEELLSSLRVDNNEYNLTSSGRTPTAASAESRITKFINESNAESFLEFFDMNANRVMHKYLYQMTHRAEYTRRFGDGGAKINQAVDAFANAGASEKDVARVQRLIATLDGSVGALAPQALKDAMGAMVTAQNLMLLGMTLFSSLVDPLGVAARTGEMTHAWKAYGIGIRGVFDQIKGPSEKRQAQDKVARWLGAIDDANMLDMMGIARDTTALAQFSRKANAYLFRYNGMDQWTSSMRIAAIEAGRAWLVEQRDNARALAEVGLTADDIVEGKNGQLALYPEEIMAGNPALSLEQATAISKRVRSGMNMFVDQAVTRSNAATLAPWMKDPRFQLLSHLKQFTVSFTHTILARAKSEYNHGNTAPIKILSLYVPFMLASDLMRGVATGVDLAAVELPTMISRAVTRSGLLGIGSFATDVVSDAAYGKAPGTSLLGPTADYLMLLIKAMFGGASWETFAARSVPNVISGPIKNFST